MNILKAFEVLLNLGKGDTWSVERDEDGKPVAVNIRRAGGKRGQRINMDSLPHTQDAIGQDSSHDSRPGHHYDSM